MKAIVVPVEPPKKRPAGRFLGGLKQNLLYNAKRKLLKSLR